MLIHELAARNVAIDMDYVARHFLGRSYAVVLATIRREFGVDLPDSFEAGYRQRLLDAFETGLKVMPGVAEAVARLRIPYCLASSSSPQRVRRSLEIAGLDAAFAGRITTAAEVAHGKPAPDLFLRAAEKMGAAPVRCLVIEDSLMGVRAGLAAGMTVWRFTGGSHMAGRAIETPDDARAHREFANFADFFMSDLLSDQQDATG